MLERGDYPVVGQGATLVEGRSDDASLLVSDLDLPLLLLGPHTGAVKFVSFPFVPGPNVDMYESGQDSIDLHFAAYLMETVSRRIMGGRRYSRAFLAAKSESYPVPGRLEQHRIVAVLEQADRAVEAAARHAADAEALLKMTIETAVTPAEHPTGWVDVALSEVTEKRSGYWGVAAPTAARENEVKVVTNAHISRRHQLTGWTTRYFSKSEYEKARLVSGDVAMTGSGEIGKLYRATGEPADLCASNFVKVLRPDDRLDAGFLFYWLSTTLARSEMQAHTGGTTLKNLHASFFTETDVSLPPLAEQQAIVARIEKVEAAVRAAETHLARLRALRSSLLENLVSGRVRLPEHETAGSKVTA